MSLNSSTVGTNVAAIIKAGRPTPGVEITDAQLTTLWQNIIASIFTGSGGITSALVTVAVTSVTGVTSGGGTSGPGTGTGTIS